MNVHTGYVGGVFLHADDDERRAVLRTAIDSGINWIDTAPSYGDGQSETAIGWLLRELEAHERPPALGLERSARREQRLRRRHGGA